MALILLNTFAWARGGPRLIGFGDRRMCAITRLPDLVIACCAQQHAADVLHVDRHFDALAEVLTFRSIRLA